MAALTSRVSAASLPFSMSFYTTIFMLAILLLQQPLVLAQQNCGGSCTTQDDCAAQLICDNLRCNDDPDSGTHICSGSAEALGVSTNDDRYGSMQPLVLAQQNCGGSCGGDIDCAGTLVCDINGRCNDNPTSDTQICNVSTNDDRYGSMQVDA